MSPPKPSRNITIGRKRLYYVPKDISLDWPEHDAGHLANFYQADDDAMKADPDTRRVVKRGARLQSRPFVYYLHWNKGEIPEGLDDRVMRDQVEPDDFAKCVLCEATSMRCLRCGAGQHVLVIEPASGHLGDMKRLPAHHINSVCPQCELRQNISIVKTLWWKPDPEGAESVKRHFPKLQEGWSGLKSATDG